MEQKKENNMMSCPAYTEEEWREENPTITRKVKRNWRRGDDDISFERVIKMIEQ